MNQTLAFDVYGTLIDPYGVLAKLQTIVADAAPAVAKTWREKQLEYTFRRAAMGVYEDFVVCTEQALTFACAVNEVSLSDADKSALLAEYRTLPPYAEVGDALRDLKAAGHRLYAFSNGHPDDLQSLLTHAQLQPLLDGIVSVHNVQSFKPDPAVYRHFLAETAATEDSCWLISGNSFDVLGAQAAGWHTAWVKRDPLAEFDPWNIDLEVVVADLGELKTAI